MFLTFWFQDLHKSRGLRLRDYRYALLKEHKLSTDHEKEVKTFFGEKLNVYYTRPGGLIKKCIFSRSNLIAKLNTLVKIKILDSFEYNNITRYRLRDGFEEYSKLIDETMLRSWFRRIGENLPILLLKEMRHYIEIEFLLNEKRIKDILRKKPEVHVVPLKNVKTIEKEKLSFYFP